mgnify:CR=1 FL=1
MRGAKFNHFERVAGVFVMVALVGTIAFTGMVAVNKGWFASRVNYVTSFESADGVFPGTMVQISGLRAGSVEEVELQNDNQIRVKFTVLAKFQHRIKQDSVVRLVRPFIIGDRVLDLEVGSEGSSVLEPGQFIKSQETTDLMSLLSGKKLGVTMEAMSGLIANLKTLGEAFLDPKRTEAVIKTFDRIDPLVKNLNVMSLEVIAMTRQMTREDGIGTLVKNANVLTNEVNAVIPELKVQAEELKAMIPAIREKAPSVAADMTNLVKNLALLTEEFKVVLPALAEIAPQLPHASRRAVEALDQAVVLLKAMQKSFVLKGSVDEVKAEEAKSQAQRMDKADEPQAKENKAAAEPPPRKPAQNISIEFPEPDPQ